MEKVREGDNYRIFKKRSGRYAVLNKEGKYINGEDKVKILVSEKLVKTKVPAKPVEEPAAEETPAEEKTEE